MTEENKQTNWATILTVGIFALLVVSLVVFGVQKAQLVAKCETNSIVGFEIVHVDNETGEIVSDFNWEKGQAGLGYFEYTSSPKYYIQPIYAHQLDE